MFFSSSIMIAVPFIITSFLLSIVFASGLAIPNVQKKKKEKKKRRKRRNCVKDFLSALILW